MTTERLYEFLILSKTCSYSRAAENLYLSQSILTRHIKDLEAELGTALFSRSTHSVSLTRAGVLLAQRAEPLLEKCDSAVTLAHIEGLSLIGTIKIACALELSYASHLQIFMQRFLRRYPNIRIVFEVKTEGTPLEYLTDYDFVITPCEYTNLSPQIKTRLLRRHGTCAVLPPGHPLLAKSLIRMGDLSGETIIVPFATEYFGPYAKNLLALQKYTRGTIRSIKASNLFSALFLVSLGSGIVVGPRYIKNLLPRGASMTGIRDEQCHFDEYIYYNSTDENGAAKLFWEEYFFTGNGVGG